jgi:hypothetical protein
MGFEQRDVDALERRVVPFYVPMNCTKLTDISHSG